MKFQLKSLTHALSAGLVLTLAACGGGGSSSDPPVATAASAPAASTDVPSAVAPPAAPPPPVTLTGAVMSDQAIRNAVVCLDLNGNSRCDADEPASARTGADGIYSLTYDPVKVTAAQVAAASLIAPMVPGTPTDAATTIDAADLSAGNTAKPYVLRQVPGKNGQINPLTTLVSAGIAAGMTEAAARGNVAVQLAIADARIDNYQDDPLFNQAQPLDNARLMAKATASALEAGAVLQVGDQAAATVAAAGDLASLSFTDAENLVFRTFDAQAKPAGIMGALTKDARAGKTAGSATAAAVLYNQAYLTPNGWLRCDGSVNLVGTRGTPSRTVFCNALPSVGYTVSSDIAGQTMTSVISAMQSDPASNTINSNVSSTGLLAALGTAIFPADSRLHVRTTLNVGQPTFINSISGDARPESETTLEEMILARTANAVNLATGAGSLGLGQSSSSARNLRVAFTGITSPTAGTVQFYDCDLSAQNVPSNCAPGATGTYAISTTNGVRTMRFAGYAETIMNHTRGFAEVQDAPTVVSGKRVFQVREMKAGISSNLSHTTRLNATSWAAVKALLGL